MGVESHFFANTLVKNPTPEAPLMGQHGEHIDFLRIYIRVESFDHVFVGHCGGVNVV